MKFDRVPLVNYTRGEEIVNCISHALGLILSGCIVARCVLPSVHAGDKIRIVCSLLYCFGITVMFLGSALYHGTRPSYRKRVLRLLDHCMIFFAVAGTATGCVPAVYDTVGVGAAVLMTCCAWVGAGLGLALTFWNFEKTKGVRIALYIGTAAVCAVCGGKAFTILPHSAFFAFLGGSGALLTGTALYGVGKKVRYFHCVFHVFIVIGLAIFFWGIQLHCF